MMWGYGQWGWLGMILGMVIMVVIWGGLIALAVWIVMKLVRSGRETSSASPIEIAKSRYARGEITKEQFEQLKKDLS